MNPRKRQILRQRGNEVAKAGRMFFDAVFGADPQKFFREKGEELEHELAQRGAIVVDGELVEDEIRPRGVGSEHQTHPSVSPARPTNRGR
jgi:hypothetical protein